MSEELFPSRTSGVWCQFHVWPMLPGAGLCQIGFAQVQGGSRTGPVCSPWWAGVTIEWQEQVVERNPDE